MIVLFTKKEYRTIFLFIIFLILYKAGDFIWDYVEIHGLFKHAIQLSYNFLIEWISRIAAWFYSAFYKNVTSAPGGYVTINGRTDVFVGPGCTGLKQILLILFIITFYPIPVKLKTFLVPLSVLIVMFSTILHFILLVPIARSFPGWFLFAHDYLTMAIFYGFFFLTWILWEKVRNIASGNSIFKPKP